MIEQDFVRSPSAENKYFRCMQSMEKPTPLVPAHFTQLDYDRETARVAMIRNLRRLPVQRLMTIVRDRGIEVMEGEVLSHNIKMLRLCEKLSLGSARNENEADVVAVRRHL